MKIRENQKRDFYHTLKIFSKNDFSLTQILPLTKKILPEKTLNELSDMINDGKKLSLSLEKCGLSDSFVTAAIKIGEETDSLTSAYQNAAEYYEQKKKIRDRMIKILAYPALVTTALITVIIFVTLYIMPNLSEIYAETNQSAPFIIKLYLNIRNITSFHGVSFIILMLILYFSIKPLISKIKISPYKTKIPRIIFLQRFLTRFKILLSAEISLSETLNILENAEEISYYREIIRKIHEKMNDGKSLSTSFSDFSEIFDENFTSHIKQGENNGDILSSVKYLCDIQDYETAKLLDILGEYGQSALILLLAIIIFIFMNTLMPLLNVGEIYLN